MTGQLLVRPGVEAVIYNTHGRILLHRRHVGRGWVPPSGALEAGETLLDAPHPELSKRPA